MAGKYLVPRTDTPGCCPKGGDSIRDKRRKIITISLAVLFFLLALGLTIYPVFSSRYNEAHQSQIHTEYQEAVNALPDTAIPEARAAAQSYNEELWSSIVQYGSYSKDSVTSAMEEYAGLLDLTGTGTMGYVHIPKLAVSLPIYHGTEEETLDRGVGHLIGSSLPIGGGSTHAILTGHSGLASQKMFSDLDKLEIGDTFYLEVLNEFLAYEVDQINTVLPHDTAYLGLEKGKDLCTLVTCTPFGVNTHRLLIRGHRIAYTPEDEESPTIEPAETSEPVDSTWEQEYEKGVYFAIGVVVVICLILFLGWLMQRGESRAS
ncbi:MAG: class C sortase [Oscillospiraceae bacterium]